MDKYVAANRAYWDYLVDLHLKSDSYAVAQFKAGGCTLDQIELAEVGEVRGKSLLHLQCHFGQDTLSWARRGASVWGADFSQPAITAARSLAAELKLEAEFICCEFSALPDLLNRQFDIVFTSAGVLPWLPDLRAWAKVAAHFVKPGGFFYIREFHPSGYTFLDDDETAAEPRLHYPYFEREFPLAEEAYGSYAIADETRFIIYEWPHSLSEVINSLIDAGLQLEFLHEFPFSTYNSHPFLRQSEDGRWRYPALPDGIPLMFSLKATKH
jgi:SAM-dependent methyltransferase